MQGKEYTTLDEMASVFGKTKSSILRRKEVEAFTFYWNECPTGKEKRFLLTDLSKKYRDAVITHRAKANVVAVPAHLTEESAPKNSKQEPARAKIVSMWAYFASRPKHIQIDAYERMAAVQMRLQLNAEADALKDKGIKPMSRSQIITQVAKHFDTSIGSVRGWSGKVQGYDEADWAAVLVSHNKGREAKAPMSPEAWNYYYTDYMRLEAPASKAVFVRLKRIAKEKGWTIPCIKTFERKLKKTTTRAQRVLARQGQDAHDRLFPAQERDRSSLHALEYVNADGHKFDVFVRWPDGEIVRPLMSAWQDVLSGKILSYRIDKSENSDAIRLSFGDLVETYGIPSHAFLDNGRAFASKWLTGGSPTRYRFKVKDDEPFGILPTLGVKVHWCQPYHGQAKPIERAFRDLCEYVAKHPAFAGAYTGNNPTAKPANYGSKAIDLDVFLKILATEIAHHNAREDRTGGVTNGRSFDQVFAESYQNSIIKKATKEQRRLWLLTAESVSVRKQDGTIHMQFEKRNRYWCEELQQFAGKKVVVRFDPQRLHDEVFCYTLDGRFIAAAQCIEAQGFGDTEAAREQARDLKRFRKATKDKLAADRSMSVREAAAMLPDIECADAPEAKVVLMAKPAREIPAPKSIQLTEVEQLAADELSLEMQEDDSEVASFGRGNDPARDFEFWQRLDARVARGEPLSEREQEIHHAYPLSGEFQSMIELKAEFSDEAAVGA